MEDGNGGEDEISESEISTSHNVRSFGISIDTSEIASVAQQDRDDELHALDIDFYEQEELEGGILNQVDNALAAAESDFKRNIIRKQLAQLEDEKQLLERELVDINKIFVSAKHGSSSANNRVSFSLLQQKQSKENAVKRLEERVRETKDSLSQLDSAALFKEDSSVRESEDSVAESVRLGELTPFEALELQKKKITIPKFKSTPIVDHPKKLGKETITKTNYLPFPSIARSPANHDRYITGNKILRILKAKGLAPSLPEDLHCLIKKAVAVRKHLERNRKDRDSKFRLILIEARIHRLARYYKTKRTLPPTWRYQSSTASALVA